MSYFLFFFFLREGAKDVAKRQLLINDMERNRGAHVTYVLVGVEGRWRENAERCCCCLPPLPLSLSRNAILDFLDKQNALAWIEQLSLEQFKKYQRTEWWLWNLIRFILWLFCKIFSIDYKFSKYTLRIFHNRSFSILYDIINKLWEKFFFVFLFIKSIFHETKEPVVVFVLTEFPIKHQLTYLLCKAVK